MKCRKNRILFIAAAIFCLAVVSTATAQGTDVNAYHWNGQEQFFEGWYFKVSDPATKKSFLFIYAVFNPDGMSPHSQAFMMLGNNSPDTAAAIFTSYPVEDFSASYEVFDTSIGEANHIYGDADELHLEGDVTDGENQCSWDVDLAVTTRWPNTMGWMAYLKNLQTYWYVGAMDASATGWIEWNGDRFIFEDILGYQEKNWGREFPKTWFWLQANNFDDPQACCLSVGGGSMPVGPVLFNAAGIGFSYGNTLYTFSFPQQPAWVRTDIVPGSWHLDARKGRYKITIDASSDLVDLINLMNPTEDGIRPYTWETLSGSVRVRLYEREDTEWKMLVDTTSNLAGLEVGGEQWYNGP